MAAKKSLPPSFLKNIKGAKGSDGDADDKPGAMKKTAKKAAVPKRKAGRRTK